MTYGRTRQLGGDASSLVSSPLPAAILMGQKMVGIFRKRWWSYNALESHVWNNSTTGAVKLVK